MEGYDAISRLVIHCASLIQQRLGPDCSAETYRDALQHQLEEVGVRVSVQPSRPLSIDGQSVSSQSIDLLVEGKVVVNTLNVERLELSHEARLLRYLKLGSYQAGLILNFNGRLLRSGIKCFRLPEFAEAQAS